MSHKHMGADNRGKDNMATDDDRTGFSSQGRAKLRVFPRRNGAENHAT